MERYQEILNRINELARTAKERDLTPAELVERNELRQEYLKMFRASFKQQLMGIKVVDEQGNDVTPEKLKQAQKEEQDK
ncbi:DUF896 domain-containing protein [Clostridium facile]|uniref:UPF0291 protein H8Z77_06120 n=1 Tax=Clostridium facile TaxID=2763035 RepID=A0ABR7IR37_9CLOT|nr:DUF896 domain-containing protein [Clostridium facile]MBC5787598.1 DUF896 domain-containing protein [Clostridium facile]